METGQRVAASTSRRYFFGLRLAIDQADARPPRPHQRSEITQIERVDEIYSLFYVPDMESTRSGLYKCTKEYSQRVAVAVVVCLLLFREEKNVPILHFNTGILNLKCAGC